MDRLVFSELSDGVLYNLFKIRICGRCCRSGLVELSWLRSVPIRAPVRLAGVGGRAPAGLLLGRVAASGLLDLPRLRKLGQATASSASRVALQFERLRSVCFGHARVADQHASPFLSRIRWRILGIVAPPESSGQVC